MKKRVLCLLLSFVMALGLVPGMCLTASAANQPVSYLDWDPAEKKLVKRDCTDYTVVDGKNRDWSSGWYVVNHNVTISISFNVTGTVHLILCDGAKLTASNIMLLGSYSLYIYGQEGSSGTLEVEPSYEYEYAGIGGTYKSHANGGNVTINGGIVKAVSNHGGAGIGGGQGGNGGNVTINGGTVLADSNNGGAGIGGGEGGNGGNVTINGGTVLAVSNTGGAGIGGGEGGNGGTVIINGGSVGASAPAGGAGIGGGYNGLGGTVTVSGGSVQAFGDSAGIGAGLNASGGTFSISGGKVTASGIRAINCEAKNSIAGIGWTDYEGTAGKARIEPSSGGQSLKYVKVQFPAAIASVSAQPAANENLTYSGAAQELVTAGTATGGTMYYAVTTETTAPADNLYTTSIPAKTDAGTYYVWYKAEGDAAHLDSDAACIPVSIGKADLTIAANRQEYIYNGQTQGEGDTVYADPAQIAEKVTVTGLKNGDYLASITLDGQGEDAREYQLELTAPQIKNNNEEIIKNDNYKITLVNGQLIIAQATSVISTAPAASAITYGQTLADSALTGGTASVAGSFSWEDSATAPAVSDSQETEYPVEFTPTNRNYSTSECKVKLTVHQADSAVTKAPEAKALTWTGSAQALVDAGQADGGTMLYALGTKEAAPAADAYTAAIPAAADAGTYYVWYMVKGDSNHNDTVPAGPITVTIAEVADGYSIRSVQGGEHVLGDNRDAVFTVTHIMDDNRPFERFRGVSAGGKDVAEGNYTKASGSLVLTLKSAYLNTLAAGDYPVRIAFTDGYVDSSLKILDAEPTPTVTPTATPKPVPKTGDSSTPLLWLCLILLATIAGGIAVKKMKNN